jgi:hypothetical protein
MKAFLVVYASTGMFVSFILGYDICAHELKNARIDLIVAQDEVKIEKARVKELEKRAADRDDIELGLRQCLRNQVHVLDTVEDVKWQMNVVLSTCPGRVRAPRLPRP